MIRPVEFFQASCDLCDASHEDGDIIAWQTEEQAVEAAQGSDWAVIEIPDPLGSESRTDPATGAVTRFYRLLLCEAHAGDGIDQCPACDAHLDPARWRFHPVVLWTITQTCPRGHESRIDLSIQA